METNKWGNEMKIGVPKEIRVLEGRVGLIPAAAGQLVSEGHELLVEQGAGILSGYADEDYRALGVQLLDSAEAVYAQVSLHRVYPSPEAFPCLAHKVSPAPSVHPLMQTRRDASWFPVQPDLACYQNEC